MPQRIDTLTYAEFAFNYLTTAITDEIQKLYCEFMESIKLINYEMTPNKQPEIIEQCHEYEILLLKSVEHLTGVDPVIAASNSELKKLIFIQLGNEIKIRMMIKSGELTKEKFLEKFLEVEKKNG